MADIKSPAERSENMSKIRSGNTTPELFVRRELFRKGYRYRIAPTYIPGHPDLFLRKYNLAIFVHGCFWHRHKGCRYAYNPKSRTEFWNKKFESNIRRDSSVKQMLEDNRIRCLVIWECAIRQATQKNGNVADFFARIEEAIRSDICYMEVSADAGFKAGRYNPDRL